MALFELARGLAGAYNGFNEGIDAEKNRQRVDVDRKYQDEQRAYQQEIQGRTRTEAARADKLRADLGAVPIEGRNQAEVFRDVSRVQAASGNIAEALKAQEAATAAAYKESANRFARFKSSAASMPVDQLVDSAAGMFNADYLPAKLANRPTVNPDGTIDVEIVMQDGQSVKHKFKDKNDLVVGMESWYSPDTYNSFVKAQREALIQQQKEFAKPVTLKPGEARYVRAPDGSLVREAENATGFEPTGDIDANGDPVMRRVPSSGRAGSGAGSGGKAPATPINDAHKYLEDALGKPDGSPEMAQRNTRALSILEGIYAPDPKTGLAPNISPRTAAFIAADATADEATGKPTKVALQLNKDTGEVETVYRNPQVEGGKPFRVATGGSAADLEKVGGKQQVAESVKGMVAELVSKAPLAQREAAMSQLVFVAKNPEQREKFLKQAASRGEDVAAWDRQLNLIRDYMSLPGEKQVKSGGVLDKLRTGVGLPPGPAAAPQASQPAKDPLEGMTRQQARETKGRLQAERDKYTRTGQSEQAKARIAEIDEQIKRIENNQY